jgi:hypothetical protein
MMNDLPTETAISFVTNVKIEHLPELLHTFNDATLARLEAVSGPLPDPVWNEIEDEIAGRAISKAKYG